MATVLGPDSGHGEVSARPLADGGTKRPGATSNSHDPLVGAASTRRRSSPHWRNAPWSAILSMHGDGTGTRGDAVTCMRHTHGDTRRSGARPGTNRHGRSACRHRCTGLLRGGDARHGHRERRRPSGVPGHDCGQQPGHRRGNGHDAGGDRRRSREAVPVGHQLFGLGKGRRAGARWRGRRRRGGPPGEDQWKPRTRRRDAGAVRPGWGRARGGTARWRRRSWRSRRADA